MGFRKKFRRLGPVEKASAALLRLALIPLVMPRTGGKPTECTNTTCSQARGSSRRVTACHSSLSQLVALAAAIAHRVQKLPTQVGTRDHDGRPARLVHRRHRPRLPRMPMSQWPTNPRCSAQSSGEGIASTCWPVKLGGPTLDFG